MKLWPFLASSLLLVSCGSNDTFVDVTLDNGDVVRLTPMAPNAVRVQIGGVPSLPELVYTSTVSDVSFTVDESASATVVTLPEMRVEVSRADGRIAYFDGADHELLSGLAYSLTPSVMRDSISTFTASAVFDAPVTEHLYGLGQFQDGYLNVRGLSRRLTQVNTQISMPMVTSSRGYSLLWNNYGLTEFNPADCCIPMNRAGEGGSHEVNVTSTEGGRREVRRDGLFMAELEVGEEGDYSLLLDVGRSMARRHNLVIDGQTVIDIQNVWLPPTTSTICHLTAGSHVVTSQLTNGDNPSLFFNRVSDRTVWSSPVAECVDYTVFAGQADHALGTYRSLTGHSPMQPLWAFGYVHCRERFHSTDEILLNAQEFRQRNLPMDVMVQDWQWWGKYGWNAFRFDEEYYPDPALLADSLHRMGSRLMLSVWSKIDGNSEVGKAAAAQGYYIPGTTWIDFFNRDASAFYWQNFRDSLLTRYDIDCWWQDATEPENDDLLGRTVRVTDPVTGVTTPCAGEVYRNIYPNFVSQTVFDGSRHDAPGHRTLILTRSGFPGIQRYGSFLWSGDVGHDWQTLRYQLAAGLGLMASGHPWWTFDAGGFFRPWGQYSDPAYHERFLRWLQIATFLPMMRVHGYMTDTEFWRFGDVVETEARRQLQLRYSLVPYIYSTGWQVTKGYTMMRPLVMDFASDATALDVTDQYMFGPSLIVCPVMQPSVTSRNVYLPYTQGGWYDFHTGAHVAGSDCAHQCGCTIADAPASLSQIPVYVRAGSIIPRALPMQTTAQMQHDRFFLDVFPGADGSFLLYDDCGTDYAYESGSYATIALTWHDASRTLTIGSRSGSYPSMPSSITFTLRLPDGSQRDLSYDGSELSVTM